MNLIVHTTGTNRGLQTTMFRANILVKTNRRIRTRFLLLYSCPVDPGATILSGKTFYRFNGRPQRRLVRAQCLRYPSSFYAGTHYPLFVVSVRGDHHFLAKSSVSHRNIGNNSNEVSTFPHVRVRLFQLINIFICSFHVASPYVFCSHLYLFRTVLFFRYECHSNRMSFIWPSVRVLSHLSTSDQSPNYTFPRDTYANHLHTSTPRNFHIRQSYHSPTQ